MTERDDIPMHPAAYWRPDVNLSNVYYLRRDGTWRLSPYGCDVPLADVPSGLVFLADYR